MRGKLTALDLWLDVSGGVDEGIGGCYSLVVARGEVGMRSVYYCRPLKH